MSEEPSGRRGVSHRTVLSVLGVSLVVALVFATYVFRRYLRYVPHAQDHVPADYAVALRLDVEQAAVRAPYRRHLLPLLALDRASLELVRDDVCEVGIVVDERGQWLVLLGGHFPRSGLVRGVAERFERKGAAVRLEQGPERLIHRSGVALGMAEDGVVVLASGEALLLAVLDRAPQGPRFRAGTALSLAIGRGDESALAGLELDVWPGEDFPIELRLPRAGEPGRRRAVAPLLSGNTGDFKLLSGLGERQGEWQITEVPGGALRGSAVLSPAEFDGAVAEIARSVRTLLGLPPAEHPAGG